MFRAEPEGHCRCLKVCLGLHGPAGVSAPARASASRLHGGDCAAFLGGLFTRRLAQETAPDQPSVTGQSGSGNGREDTQPFPWEPNVTCSRLSLPALEPEVANSFCECDRGGDGQRPRALQKSRQEFTWFPVLEEEDFGGVFLKTPGFEKSLLGLGGRWNLLHQGGSIVSFRPSRPCSPGTSPLHVCR